MEGGERKGRKGRKEIMKEVKDGMEEGKKTR